jgi:Cu(I)/Ag(I) efflux system periplasmic protein CusF
MKTTALFLLVLSSLVTSLSGAADALPLVDAEVRKVDTAAAKITLKHGDIPNLDMPPMTMVFQVSNPGQLEGLKAGDKVKVRVDKVNGAYTALEIQR